eukprot:838574-Prymnesium_polylepis.1
MCIRDRAAATRPVALTVVRDRAVQQGPGKAAEELDHDCIDFDVDFDSWGRTLLLLLEGTLTSENWLE